MSNDADHLETHFVENPYIKVRERASQKHQGQALGEEELQKESAQQDLYYQQETGKMVVNDLEKADKEKIEK